MEADSVSEGAVDKQKILIDIAIESWRFSRVFLRVLSKLDAGEAKRYMSTFKYYIEKLEYNLDCTGIRLVNLEGQPFDTGMAVKALNIEDFSPDDRLFVFQMLEPVIMGGEGLIKEGTVMLEKEQV